MGSSSSLQSNINQVQAFSPVFALSEEDKIQISKIISSHCLLCNFSPEKQAQCLQYFFKQQFIGGQYIYRQNDKTQSMYIIKEGTVRIQIDCSLIKSLSDKQYFGHEGVCFDRVRNESVRVITNKLIVYSIRKEKINPFIIENMKEHLENNKEMFSKIHFFNYLTNIQRKVLIDNTRKYIFKQGEILFQKQHDANTFYIIKKGTILIEIQGKANIEMHQGDYFGESAFSLLIHKGRKRQRMGRAKAKENGVQVYAIELSQIKENLGIYVRSIFFFNLFKWALFRDDYLKTLPSANYHILLQLLKVREGHKYQVLAAKGSKVNFLFIPLQAQINKSKELKLYCSKYLNSSSKKVMDQQIRLTEDGFYAFGLIDEFKMVLFGMDQGTLSLQDELKFNKLKQPLYKSMTLNIKNISRYSKKLVSSHFSTILIAQDMRFGNEFIIKIYKKPKNIKNDQNINTTKQKVPSNQLQTYHKRKTFKILKDCDTFQDNKQNIPCHTLQNLQSKQDNPQHKKPTVHLIAIMKQRQIASVICSKYICGYYKAQQDMDNYYLYYEYVKGISLQSIINTFGILPNKMAKFYLASLAQAIEYFHSQRIVYRNLHPSDIIIKHNGNITLIDYSTSKLLDQTGKTSTLIGVPYYMAPEIIQKQVYTYNCDIWSLGVVLYEMLTGLLPFAYGQNDPLKIFQCILLDEPNYCRIKDKNAKVLVKSLLQRDPLKRIKHTLQIRNFKYINDLQFKWQQFLQQKLTPVYFPNCSQDSFATVDNQQFFDENLIQDWN